MAREATQPSQPLPSAKTGQQVADEVAAKPPAAKEDLRIDQSILMSEVQLLLAERRTAFAEIRTGITISLVPFSITTFLLATRKTLGGVSPWLWVVLGVAAALLIPGAWLIVGGLTRTRRASRALEKMRTADTLLEQLLDRRP